MFPKENPHLDRDYAERLEKAQCAIGETLGRAGRPMSVRQLLLNKAEHMRQEAHRLETLAYALPEHLGEADGILYGLVLQAHATR